MKYVTHKKLVIIEARAHSSPFKSVRPYRWQKCGKEVDEPGDSVPPLARHPYEDIR